MDNISKMAEFPEEAYLIATDSGLDIIDATDNKLWMRFEKSTGWTNANVIVDQLNYGGVFALNGKIYMTAPWGGLVSVDFKGDAVFCRGSNPDYGGDYLGDIAQRNAGQGYSMSYSGTIAHYDAREVHGNVIDGVTYIAVATDAGVSLINENTGSIVSLLSQSESTYPDFDTSDIVWLTSDGTLYSQLYRDSDFSNRILLCVNYDVQNETGDFDGCDTSYHHNSTPAFIGDSYTAIYDLFATSDTSTADGGDSNTIYLAQQLGVAVIQEKQGDESNGTVEYYGYAGSSNGDVDYKILAGPTDRAMAVATPTMAPPCGWVPMGQRPAMGRYQS